MRWIGKHHLEFVNDNGVSCYIKFDDAIYRIEREIHEAIDAKNIDGLLGKYPDCFNDA